MEPETQTFYERNKDHCKSQAKKYYEANKEKYKAYNKMYYESHKQKLNTQRVKRKKVPTPRKIKPEQIPVLPTPNYVLSYETPQQPPILIQTPPPGASFLVSFS